MTDHVLLSPLWRMARVLVALAVTAPAALALQAATNPWQTAVNRLEQAFVGPIGRSLSLVAIVISGLMFAFGEAGSKRTLAGVIFGIAMAMGAITWLNWLTN